MAFDPDAYLKQNGGNFDPDAYLHGPQSLPDQLEQAAIASLKNIGSSSLSGAKEIATMGPKAQKVASSLMPIAGGIAGAPFGLAAPGAALGEFGRQTVNTVIDPENVPKTPFGRFASTVGAGVMQDPKILNAIPGVPQVSEMASGMLSKFTKGLARAGETMTGVKAKDLAQAAKQGLSTYMAPSLEKASATFGKALGKEGQEALKVPATEAFDSALGRARSIATDIGVKIEKGEAISSIDALKARQATDRIISSTPVTDKLARRNLYDWRSKFDDIISSQNGPLKDASTQYRQAIVKDKILNLTRLNKSGEPSAFLPMLAGHGAMSKGLEAGLGMLTMTSPLVAGAAATAGGSATRGLNAIAQNPESRQVLMQVLQRLIQNKQGQK